MRITAGPVSATATLAENATARAIWDALPIEAQGSIWGDEIYFAIPVKREEEAALDVVQLGDLGYWPPGNAFCIFYGPTPASRGAEIRPAIIVPRIGRLLWCVPSRRSDHAVSVEPHPRAAEEQGGQRGGLR